MHRAAGHFCVTVIGGLEQQCMLMLLWLIALCDDSARGPKRASSKRLQGFVVVHPHPYTQYTHTLTRTLLCTV